MITRGADTLQINDNRDHRTEPLAKVKKPLGSSINSKPGCCLQRNPSQPGGVLEENRKSLRKLKLVC